MEWVVIMCCVVELMFECIDEFVSLIMFEMGKLLCEVKGEVVFVVSIFNYYGE